MDKTSSNEGSRVEPDAAPQEAASITIRGAVTYDELMRTIEARNPIIANRRR